MSFINPYDELRRHRFLRPIRKRLPHHRRDPTLRFNELRSQVDGISQRMLTVTLRGLERDGLVQRTIYPEFRRGSSTRSRHLARPCASWCAGPVRWSGAHLAEVDAARARYDARHGPPARNGSVERIADKRRVSQRA